MSAMTMCELCFGIRVCSCRSTVEVEAVSRETACFWLSMQCAACRWCDVCCTCSADMAALEAEVRAIQKDGLLWGACERLHPPPSLHA